MARTTKPHTPQTMKRKRRSSKEVWTPRTATPAEMEEILKGKTKSEQRAIKSLMGGLGLLPGSKACGLLQISALVNLAEALWIVKMGKDASVKAKARGSRKVRSA